MSKKTIAKFLAFVILICVVSFSSMACSSASMHGKPKPPADPRSAYGPPRITGRIDLKDINESSGIAASKCQPGVFWTLNDSGDDAFIFAINEKGDDLGTWRVESAQNFDWEDIAEFRDASGKCSIYIGEIGDNDLERPVHSVYRVNEPIVSGQSSGTDRKTALLTDPAEQVKFRYADRNANAETLMVHPTTGDIYVLTKRFDGPSAIYKIKPSFGSDSVAIAEKLGDLAVPNVPNGYLTGGDISPDGKRAVVCDYSAAYELSIPADSTNFDDIWTQTPVMIDRGDLEQGEAVGYTPDGNSLILTSEKKRSPVVMIERQKK
jgi:hypothetical protein